MVGRVGMMMRVVDNKLKQMRVRGMQIATGDESRDDDIREEGGRGGRKAELPHHLH